MDDTARFFAFLSYSHKDRQFAGWLHRALESYHVPKAVVGSIVSQGPVPPRLTPIFRDREELAASADLGSRLTEALAESKYLIVVCSPAAAVSRWTNEEIETFKKQHGSERILAAIVAGEPNASTIAGREVEECFPPALRFELAPDGSLTDIPAEPIAADFRAEGDGKRLAKLKLIAGMLGVPLDTLVQREAQRRNRRLVWLSAASVGGMAVTSGLAVAAIQARDEARFQRGEAAGLVQYMLTDLRKKLEPVGRLEVLDGVGQRALSYYQKQDVANLSPDELGQRATALNLVGEVRYTKGDLPNALAAFLESSRTTREQLGRSPDDPKRHFDNGQSSFWVGQVAWQRGDYKTARRYFDQYLAMSQWLADKDPAKAEWQLELSYAHNSLAVLDQEEGNDRAALAHFAISERILKAIGAADPRKRDLAFQLAQTLAWSSKSHADLGNLAEVIRLRKAESELYDGMLAVDPKDFTPLASKLVAEGNIARSLLWQGKAVDAKTVLSEMESTESRLMAQDPSNTVWREIAARYWLTYGETALAIGNQDLADRVTAKARDYCAILIKADAKSPSWDFDCVVPAMWARAALANQRGDTATVAAAARQFAARYSSASALEKEPVRFAKLVFSRIDNDPTNDGYGVELVRKQPFNDRLRQAAVMKMTGRGAAGAVAYPLETIIGPSRRKI